METKNIILIAIAVLVIALIAVGAYVLINDNSIDLNITNATNNTTTKNITNVTNKTNDTVKNTTKLNDTNKTNKVNKTNQTYKVYNPQTDSYVEVIGEAYDKEVGRWYTYDRENVRYYNTRIWA